MQNENIQRLEYILQNANHQPGCILKNYSDKVLIKTMIEAIMREHQDKDIYNKELIQQKGLELTKVKEAFKTFLYQQKFIKRVYTEEEIMSNGGTDYYLNCISRGYDPVQNGELVFVFKPAYIEYSSTGTSHGSPYTYDTHVPLIFFGWNIKKGQTHDRKEITQIAPILKF